MKFDYSIVTIEELRAITDVDFKKHLDWLVTMNQDTLFGNITIFGSKIGIYNSLSEESVKLKNKKIFGYRKNGDFFENHGQFMKVELRGVVNILSVEVQEQASMGPNGMIYGANRKYTDYYLKRAGNDPPTFATSTAKYISKKRGFKKIVSEYFKDCPELVERINSTYENDDLHKIVEFYNAGCQE